MLVEEQLTTNPLASHFVAFMPADIVCGITYNQRKVLGKENRRKFIDAYPTVSRTPAGLCFESPATRGSWSAAVASVAYCKQSHQDKRKRWRRHSYSPSFSARSSQIFLSSLPRAEPSVNPAHSATPRHGDSVLAGERSQQSICNQLLPQTVWGEVPTFNMQPTSPQKSFSSQL